MEEADLLHACLHFGSLVIDLYMRSSFPLYMDNLKKLFSLSIYILHLPGFGSLEIICPKQMNYLCFAMSLF